MICNKLADLYFKAVMGIIQCLPAIPKSHHFDVGRVSVQLGLGSVLELAHHLVSIVSLSKTGFWQPLRMEAFPNGGPEPIIQQLAAWNV